MDGKQELMAMLESRKRTANILSLLTIVAVLAVGALFIKLGQSRVALEKSNVALEESNQALQVRNDTIAHQLQWIKKLKHVNDSLSELVTERLVQMQNVNDSLRALIPRSATVPRPTAKPSATPYAKGTIGAEAIKAKGGTDAYRQSTMELVRAVSNARQLITLHSSGATAAERVEVQTALRDNGYLLELGHDFAAHESPKWMAIAPTVFYYHSSSLQTAQNLAKILNESTETNFNVRPGNGLGVMKGQERNTFFIHLIR
jgi:hypothetical protein